MNIGDDYMQNFNYSIPTKVFFGKGQIKVLGDQTNNYGSKVLLTYGGGNTIDCSKAIGAGYYYEGDPWHLSFQYLTQPILFQFLKSRQQQG